MPTAKDPDQVSAGNDTVFIEYYFLAKVCNQSHECRQPSFLTSPIPELVLRSPWCPTFPNVIRTWRGGCRQGELNTFTKPTNLPITNKLLGLRCSGSSKKRNPGISGSPKSIYGLFKANTGRTPAPPERSRPRADSGRQQHRCR